MKTTREMIEVMEAYERGEKVEFRLNDFHDWHLVTGSPIWNWHHSDYRIAPKPKRTWDVWVMIIEHPSGAIDFHYSLYDDPRNTGIILPTDKILAIKKITLTEGDGMEGGYE